MQTDRLQVKGINQIEYADQYPGATADVKISAAIAALSSGGTVDCRGFGATTQSLVATITVASGVTLLFDPATGFQPTSSSLNVFIFEPDAVVDSFRLDLSTQPSYSGIVFQNDTTKFYTNGQNTAIRNIEINSGNNASAGNSSGTALKLSSTSSSLGVAFVTLENWRVWGLLDGVFMTTSGTGFVNGNHFINCGWSNSAHGVHMTPVAGGAGQNITGNAFESCFYEKDASGTNGWLIDGTGGNCVGNRWTGEIWDTVTAISVTNSGGGILGNSFDGYFSGSVSDVTGTTSYRQTATGDLTLGGKYSSIYAGGSGDNFSAAASGTNHRTLHLANTGGAVFVGVDDSSGGTFGNGAYITNIYSPSNNVVVTAPVTQTQKLALTAAAPTVSAGQVGLGSTNGFGNGSSGTAMTTTTKGTGSGPTTPQTVTQYLEINVGGTNFWIPLVQ